MTVTVSGLPPDKEAIRVNYLNDKTIDSEIVVQSLGNPAYMDLTYFTIFIFIFWTQLSPISAFAITIYKSLGDTFNRAGILVRQPIFTYGSFNVHAIEYKRETLLCLHQIIQAILIR